MPDSEDEQWSRISAEAELRPEHGVVADVPPALITPVPDDEPLFDPIELNEVPLLEGEVPEVDAEPEPDAAPPIQIVPFQAGPMVEAGPDVIVAAPFDVRGEAAPVEVEEPVEMITDVPVPHPDPVEVVADLPEEKAQPEKTPWWRLMLGGGESRSERRAREPEAAEPQPRPVPPEGAETDSLTP
jgi:hypothetical protein